MIEIDQVGKSYDGRHVVDALSLTVAAGEFCVLLGSSGAGNSTLLRMVSRLAGPGALRPAKSFLGIAEGRVGAAVLENAHDIVREAVFVDAVAEADQLIDIMENIERPRQAGQVAVHVRDDAEGEQPPACARGGHACRRHSPGGCTSM